MEQDWDAQKVLDMYIHDYLKKKNLHNVADTFAKEAGFTPRNVAINAPEGFLTEWWAIFYDMYTATVAKHPEQGETLMAKAEQMMASLGKEFPPNMTMPEMNSVMQNANPGVRIPGVPSMLQPVSAAPLMSRPGIGFLNQNPSSSTMPRLGQNPNRLGPASVIDFSSKQGEGVTNHLEAIMREQELHRSQAGGFNFNPQLLNIDRLASMVPSSSTPRRVHNAPLTINNQPRVNRARVHNAPVTINNQPYVNRARVHNAAIIMGRPAVPMPSQARALQIRRGAAETGSSMSSNSNSTDPSYEAPETSSDMSMSS